jgi:hypothetical protein
MTPDSPVPTLRRAALWLLPVAIVGVAYTDILGFDFVGDSRFLILENRYMGAMKWLWANLTHDYFWSSSGSTIPYWRPFTKGSWLFETQIFGRRPMGFFAVQLAWLLAGVLGVQRLARALGASEEGAAFSALMFGFHPAVVEPASLLMARSDVVAATGGIWAVAAWLSWRASGSRAWALGHVAFVIVSLGSKEAAIVLAPALTTWAIADGDLQPARRSRLRTLVPVWLLSGIYLALRRIVLGVAGTASIVSDPARVFVTLGSYLVALPPGRVGGRIHNLSLAEAHSPARWLLAAAGILLFLGLAAWGIARRRAAVVGLAGLIVWALFPVVLVASIHVPRVAEKYPMADRWLLLSVAAASVLYAFLAESIPRPRSSRIFLVAGALVTVVGLSHARGAHRYYENERTLLDLDDERYESLPEAFRTLEDRCAFIDRQLVRSLVANDLDRVQALTRDAPHECPGATQRQFNLFAAQVRANRFAEARPALDSLLVARDLDPRVRGPFDHLAGIVLLETGDPAGAEAHLRSARAHGIRSCALLDAIGRALAAQGKTAEAARYDGAAQACAAASQGRALP